MAVVRRPALARARVGALALSVPVWAWLAGLVALSAVVRFWLARRSPAPWIWVDELIYSELAKSIAEGGRPAIRDVPTDAYGFVYPILVAPAYLVFDNVAHAYAAAKAINALLMSLAAVPAYLLARRLLGPGLSLVAALLAVALPSLAYTGTIMTENAFYPVFLGSLLLVVLALERPTAWRQSAALAAVAVAFLVRVQAVALVAALVSAYVLAALLEARAAREPLRSRRFARRLWAFRLTWLVLGGGALLFVLVQVARGRELVDVLGAYQAAGDVGYSVGGVARWLLYHVAELDLYLGVVPFLAFLVIAAIALRRDAPRALRLWMAAAVPAVVWLTLLVATFASQPSVLRVQERNLFYVAPLFLIALLVWVDRGPRLRAWTVVAAAGCVALLAALPYETLIGPSAVSDTFALLPLWNLQAGLVSGADVKPLVVLAGLVVALLFLVVPRRAALLLPALVLGYFAVAHNAVQQRIEEASVGGLYAGIRVEREWIDEALPDGAEATAVWSGNTTVRTIWLNEFFNRAVGPILDVGAPLPGSLPETPVSVDPDTGALTTDGGGPAEAVYAMSDGSFPLAGEVVARDDGTGVTLYRTEGPLVLAARIEGLHPNDTWSGPVVTYTRLACDGGQLVVNVTSDPALFSTAQTLTASVDGREVSRATVEPTAVDQEVVVPLEADGGTCTVVFEVSPTAVPDELDGRGDTRELGLHFTSFTYRP
jgi:hypothetical protein